MKSSYLRSSILKALSLNSLGMSARHPLKRGAFQSISNLNRYFIDLDSTANAHYELATPWVASGDFRIHVDFYASSFLSGDFAFIGSESPVDDFFRLDASNNGIDTKIGGVFYDNDGAFTLDDKYHTIIWERIGGTQRIVLDGVEIINRAVLTSALNVARIGVRDNVSPNYFEGIIANVKLEDLDTPSNTQTYLLNQATANFEYPVENMLGANIINNPDFDTATSWIITGGASISGGEAIIDGTGGQSLVFQNALTQGKTYQIDIDVTFDDGNNNNELWNNNGEIIFEIDGVGMSTFVYHHSIANGNILLRANGGEWRASSISVREVINAATYQNIALSDRELFTQDANEDWVGNVNTWDDPPSLIGSQWTDNGGGSYTLLSDGSFNTLTNSLNSEAGKTYKISCLISGHSGPGTLRYSNSSSSVFTASSNGVQSEVYVADGSGDATFVRHTAGLALTATVSEITIKRFLEVAP